MHFGVLYVCCCSLPFSHESLFLRFIHVDICKSNSLSLAPEQQSLGLSPHSSLEGRFGHSHLSTVLIRAAVNTHKHCSWGIYFSRQFGLCSEAQLPTPNPSSTTKSQLCDLRCVIELLCASVSSSVKLG